jgi:YjbE family integral membrane protein
LRERSDDRLRVQTDTSVGGRGQLVELIAAGLSIVLINLVLSGDNAVVIGMAAHRLPQHQRRMAIIVGSGAAIVLRVILTAVATILLQLPWIRLVGGALLLWIGYKLLEEEEEQHEGSGKSGGFYEAISTIIVADFVMSVDNILGVAAAARGDLALLIFGLVFSMIVVMVGGTLIASMIDRFWWLAYVGSAVIAWTGAEMMFEDSVVVGLIGEPGTLTYVLVAAITLAVLGAAHYMHRYRPTQRRLGSQASGD